MGTEYIACGGMQFPLGLAELTRTVYFAIMIILPIILIVMGSIDIVKAVTGSDEASIKKARDAFPKRLISAGAVFLILSVTSLLVNILSDDNDDKDLTQCISCLINDESKCSDSIKVIEKDHEGEEFEN